MTLREIERIEIKEAQRIEYIIAHQDPAVLGPDARVVVTKFAVEPGDVLVVYRPAPELTGPGTPVPGSPRPRF